MNNWDSSNSMNFEYLLMAWRAFFLPATASPVCCWCKPLRTALAHTHVQATRSVKVELKWKWNICRDATKAKCKSIILQPLQAMFLWLLFIINIWPVFASKRIACSVACAGVRWLLVSLFVVACSQFTVGSVVWRGHYLISSSIKTKYYSNSKYYHLFHVMN